MKKPNLSFDAGNTLEDALDDEAIAKLVRKRLAEGGSAPLNLRELAEKAGIEFDESWG